MKARSKTTKKHSIQKDIQIGAWGTIGRDICKYGMTPCDGIVAIWVERGFPTGIMPIHAISKKHRAQLDCAIMDLHAQAEREADKIPCPVCGRRRI